MEVRSTLELRRFCAAVDSLRALFVEPLQAISRWSARMRTARRRRDEGAVIEARTQLAEIHLLLGSHARAHRHFEQLNRVNAGGGDALPVTMPPASCFAALNVGWFDKALTYSQQSGDPSIAAHRDVFLAHVRLRLGQWDLAQALLSDAMSSAALNPQWSAFHVGVCAQAELDDLRGADPLPKLRHAESEMQRHGVSGVKLRVLSWEILRRTARASLRITEGQDLIASLRGQGNSTRWLPLLLDVASAHEEAGSAGGRPFALEAARLLRRGYAIYSLYPPKAMVDCARLLGPTDPREASTLMHVARRWVLEAFPHVVSDAQQSFRAVPINELLLQQA